MLPIGPPALGAIGPAVHSNPDPQQAIARLQRNDPGLTILEWRHLPFDDHYAKALTEALKRNSSLTTLNLSNNQLGTPSAQALALALALAATLQHNSSLTVLELRDTEPRGTRAIDCALHRNGQASAQEAQASWLAGQQAMATSECWQASSHFKAAQQRVSQLDAPRWPGDAGSASRAGCP